MLKIQALASGSKGNITLIASENTRILVDVGLNLTQTLKRLNDAQIAPDSIDAILVTHEHSDHINGIAHFMKRYNCDIYVPKIACTCFLRKIGGVEQERVYTFTESFEIGDIGVDYFPVPHDSEYCFGYTFDQGDCKVSVATDLGSCPQLAIQKMAGSQVVLLECNHDMKKLESNVKYPNWLKRRIAGGTGHLSNTACASVIAKLISLGAGQIILAHLSEENNSPNLAYCAVCEFLEKHGIKEGTDICIDIATQNIVGRPYIIE